MTPIVIDGLEGVEAWKAGEGQPIPFGDHVTEIDDVKEGLSSNKNPQVEIYWRVVDGPYRGATSREWLPVLPQTKGKIKALLEALKFPIPPGQFVMPTGELVGKRALTTWREDTYGGKVSIKCVGHSPVPVVVGGDVPIAAEGLPDPDDLPF